MKKNLERTLSIIKPDAVSRNLIGRIYSKFEDGGLKIVSAKMKSLSTKEAEEFYVEHKEKVFFDELVEFITSGPIMIQILEGEDAISKNRKIMGSTNPKEADPGTIRADFGISIEKNSVHGSDSPESAKREINFFFNKS